ncbi:MAG TPA: hypothetical protein VG166_08680 [Caulobacteraceae bacterium]|jgi:hypothetical protein|nr:hypothetical protein [Caulobacteraceae bacterium]
MHDKLAEGIAAGLSWHEAAARASYAPTSRSYYRLKSDPRFQRLVERHRRRREWAGIGDLGDIVGSLLAKSRETEATTAGQNLSRLCLVSAAQLFLKMPGGPLEDGTSRPQADTTRQQAGTTRPPGDPSMPIADTSSREAAEIRRALDEWAATVGVK